MTTRPLNLYFYFFRLKLVSQAVQRVQSYGCPRVCFVGDVWRFPSVPTPKRETTGLPVLWARVFQEYSLWDCLPPGTNGQLLPSCSNRDFCYLQSDLVAPWTWARAKGLCPAPVGCAEALDSQVFLVWYIHFFTWAFQFFFFRPKAPRVSWSLSYSGLSLDQGSGVCHESTSQNTTLSTSGTDYPVKVFLSFFLLFFLLGRYLFFRVLGSGLRRICIQCVSSWYFSILIIR